MVERLTLSEKRIEEIAEGAAQLIQLPDPCGRILKRWTLPNGLDIIRTSVPFGVIAMIYESRPNVTAMRRHCASKVEMPVCCVVGRKHILPMKP